MLPRPYATRNRTSTCAPADALFLCDAFNASEALWPRRRGAGTRLTVCTPSGHCVLRSRFKLDGTTQKALEYPKNLLNMLTAI